MNLRDAINRNPSTAPTPLDRASFYIEELKYGPKPGRLERARGEEIAAEIETLLRDAGITSMTGRELLSAAMYYGESFSRQMGMPFEIALSLWVDGVMHGIAFGAGIEGPDRNPKGQ